MNLTVPHHVLMTTGEAIVGTDEDMFVEIIGHAGQRQCYLIFEEYKKVSGITIEQAMQNEMSGEVLNGLLAIGNCSTFFILYINN